jgi:C-terminal peptidase prc
MVHAHSVMMAALLGLAAPALAADADRTVPREYERAIDLTHRLYLRKDELEPSAMLASAVDVLVSRLDWLFADIDGNTVTLRHGRGRDLGTVSITGWEDLPAALYDLERLIAESGYDTGEVDLRLSSLSGGYLALDRYSRVLSGDSLDRFDTRLKGTLVGIGATLRIVDEALTIIAVLPDGPAERGDLQVGDIIERIDEASTVGMPVREAVNRIRGENGTKVTLHVRRTVDEAEVQLSLPMVRAKVILPNVEHDVLDGDVGYIRITSVSQKTVYNLRRAMAALRAEGALEHGVVLDLRGNTGGSMKESSGAVDEFVSEGVVLTTAGHDGKPVPHLLAKLQTDDDGNEPDVPLVVLVDDRTASGAEIISGALQRLDRAALVGERTFGKGEVQKIYDLDGKSRLKLTVAEYLLDDETRVAGVGITPDITLGRVLLDDRGARLLGFDVERENRAFFEIVQYLDEREGWRETPIDPEDVESTDVGLEIARRAVLDTSGPSREAIVASVERAAEALRAEESAKIAEALAVRAIDWSAAEYPGSAPEAVVSLEAKQDPEDLDVQVLSITVENQGPSALHRALVELDSESFNAWDLLVPLGRIESGATAVSEVRVPLRPDVEPRADEVVVQLRADRRPPATLPPAVLTSSSPRDPQVHVVLRLDGVGAERTAKVSVRNLDDQTRLEGLEASFRYPKVAGIELLSEGMRLPELEPGASGTFDLPVRIADETLRELPLQLKLQTDRHGSLVVWDVEVPVSGEAISLEAPRIEAKKRKLTQRSGPGTLSLVVSDDTKVGSVVVFVNDEKVAWQEGGQPRVDVKAKFEIVPGDNEIKVVARDADGLRSVEYFHILGQGLAGDGVVEE